MKYLLLFFLLTAPIEAAAYTMSQHARQTAKLFQRKVKQTSFVNQQKANWMLGQHFIATGQMNKAAKYMQKLVDEGNCRAGFEMAFALLRRISISSSYEATNYQATVKRAMKYLNAAAGIKVEKNNDLSILPEADPHAQFLAHLIYRNGFHNVAINKELALLLEEQSDQKGIGPAELSRTEDMLMRQSSPFENFDMRDFEEIIYDSNMMPKE